MVIKLLALIGISTMLTTILILISFWLPPQTPNSEKLSPYECGFDPCSSARLPFSMRFFLIAILFLLFDLEIALLLPLPWAINTGTPTNTLILISTLIILLATGLIYEWSQDALEWADSVVSLNKTIDFDSINSGRHQNHHHGHNPNCINTNILPQYYWINALSQTSCLRLIVYRNYIFNSIYYTFYGCTTTPSD